MSQVEKHRVLCVDDSKLALKVVRRFLEDTEFEVIGEALDGNNALSLYGDLSPDVVMLDVVMPGMDVTEILDRLFRIDPSARVLMLSSLATREKIVECLKRGAKNFLAKPYEKDALVNALRRVCEEV